MRQELAEEAGVQVAQPQPRRGAVQASGGEAQQQTEGVAVGDHGVWTGLVSFPTESAPAFAALVDLGRKVAWGLEGR
jgi:hypothetical protein